ncbi:MAG: chromate resistance protein, partial [Acidobacteria bacterium]|nr:chromate resistance protein [Acidobacteriota bacterium]
MDWLLLLHQIPPQPPYFRAKVLRRLTQLGALAIKNSAYVIPASDETLEDFQWLRQEIEREGGEAWLFRTEIVSGLSDDAVRDAFRALRTPEYQELAEAGRAFLERLRKGKGRDSENDHEAEWRKLKKRFDEIRKLDFFDAPAHTETEAIMESIDRILHSPPKKKGTKPRPQDLKGCMWVTRRGVKVDRIASAWLIRSFIDPAARFSFVDPKTYKHAAGEVRFDMFEGEFTHEDDLCTFEVLLAWSGLKDRALRAVAEVVHDIDLKDAKHRRPESAGIAPVIEGITLRHTDDAKRLEEGFTVFEALYARFKAGK